MTFEFFISALVTLLVVVDPVGLVPIFTSLTARLPATARRRVALERLLGVILAALAVQFVIDGVRAVWS